MTEHDRHWRWAGVAAPSPGPAQSGAGTTGARVAAASAGTPGTAGAPAMSETTDIAGTTGNTSTTGTAGTTGTTGTAPPVLTARQRWAAALADRLPPTLRGRWKLERTTGIVLAVSVLSAALLVGGWTLLRSRPHELAVSRDRSLGTGAVGDGRGDPWASPQGSAVRGIGARTGAADAPAAPDAPGAGVAPGGVGGVAPAAPDGGAAPDSAGAGVVVDVEGKVARPGVRTLPAGSRVIDALTAAGGALPGTDLSTLNQARVLVDGEQVLVGVSPPPVPVATPGRGRGKGRAGNGVAEPVRLNSAAVEDLEQLPGVGPALAQRIVDYRTEHGPFHSVEELREVKGFGGQRYQSLAPLLTL